MKMWSAPTTQVATELGISDVALAKRCKKLNVPKPPLGYWAKVAAGQKPEKMPFAPDADQCWRGIRTSCGNAAAEIAYPPGNNRPITSIGGRLFAALKPPNPATTSVSGAIN